MSEGKQDEYLTIERKYGPSETSEAALRYARLHPDRARQLEKLRKIAQTPRLQSEHRSLADFQQKVSPGDDPSLSPIANEVTEVLLERFQDQLARDPREILYGRTAESDVVAMESSFSDGSGLVVISDSLSSMTFYLAQINTLWLRWCRECAAGSRNMTDEEMVEAFQQESKAAASLVCVRYWVLQQRIFGLGAQFGLKLNDNELGNAVNLSVAAQTFILAHEAAHHVLGHGASEAELTAAHLQAADSSLEAENEADSLAIAVTPLALKWVFGAEAETMALVGGVLALLAMSANERGLFVRQARTHPATSLRMQRLSFSFSPEVRRKAHVYIFGAAIAAEYGEAFVQPLSSHIWTSAQIEPGIHHDHPTAEVLGMMKNFDELHGNDPAKLSNGICNLLDGLGINSAATRSFAAGGSLEGLLRSWGVHESDAAAILDPDQPLLFFALQSALAASKVLAEVDDLTTRTFVATALALLTQRVSFTLPEFFT